MAGRGREVGCVWVCVGVCVCVCVRSEWAGGECGGVEDRRIGGWPQCAGWSSTVGPLRSGNSKEDPGGEFLICSKQKTAKTEDRWLGKEIVSPYCPLEASE